MRRVDGRMLLSFFHIVGVGWGGAITSVSCLAFSLGCYANVRSLAQSCPSVCPVRWKHVSNVAGTQMSDRSWQNVKFFLLEHMYIKCKEKGHSIVRCTQVFLTTYTCGVGDKVSEQLHHGNFWQSMQSWKNGSDQCHGQKWCWPKLVSSNTKIIKINSSLWPN